MRAKVLKMGAGATDKAPKKEVRNRRESHMAEDRTARYLMVGKDDRGKTIYYIRFSTTGLRRRLFGPYSRKGHAIDAFDGLLCDVLEAHTNAENDADGNTGREMIEQPHNLSFVK